MTCNYLSDITKRAPRLVNLVTHVYFEVWSQHARLHGVNSGKIQLLIFFFSRSILGPLWYKLQALAFLQFELASCVTNRTKKEQTN